MLTPQTWLLTIVLEKHYINKSYHFYSDVPLRAVGHWTYGSTYREQLVEQVRRAAEHCDCLQCFFLIHSMGGGESSSPTTTTPPQHCTVPYRTYETISQHKNLSSTLLSVEEVQTCLNPLTSVGWLCRHRLGSGHICPKALGRGIPWCVPHCNLSLPLCWGRRHHLTLQ